MHKRTETISKQVAGKAIGKGQWAGGMGLVICTPCLLAHSNIGCLVEND